MKREGGPPSIAGLGGEKTMVVPSVVEEQQKASVVRGLLSSVIHDYVSQKSSTP